VPTPANDFLGPVLAELLARYPELRVEVVAADGTLDLLAGGFDAALHVGAVGAAGSLGVVRLGRIAPVLAASARYLERAPPLRHPHDLADPGHAIIAYGRSRRVRRWEFVHAKGATTTVEVPAGSRALVTSKALVAQLVAAGSGLALIPRPAAHRLPGVVILEPGGYRPAAGPFSVVTPSARTAAPKVRAFVDVMRAFVAAHPDLFD
jgi:DNA-binding transcriptional LysR family regulator